MKGQPTQGQSSFRKEPNIKYTDLEVVINVQAIQSLMDDFYELTSIGIAILDLNGKILVATGWQDICYVLQAST